MRRIKNLASGWSTWVHESVIERATSEVNCGNVEDVIALDPDDWPEGAGPFDDGSNVWKIMHH